MDNNLYEELKQRKQRGEKLEWEKITKEELEELFKNTP